LRTEFRANRTALISVCLVDFVWTLSTHFQSQTRRQLCTWSTIVCQSIPAPQVRADVVADIHVWSPLKAGTFDSNLGLNTYINLCWPVTLQDEMLFDATIAASRVAWCLHQNLGASDDTFMLYHRGMAMTRLRQCISASTPNAVTTEVLFTIGRMLSIAYMADERDSFDFHLRAFQRLTRWYMPKGPTTEIDRVIEHRLRSWEALQDYRSAVVERSRSHTLPAELQQRVSIVPEGLRELVMSGSL
jgi:hypothetical protein